MFATNLFLAEENSDLHHKIEDLEGEKEMLHEENEELEKLNTELEKEIELLKRERINELKNDVPKEMKKRPVGRPVVKKKYHKPILPQEDKSWQSY